MLITYLMLLNYYHLNKLTSVFLLICVCPVIDHEFRHIIVKVAVDPQTTLTML